MACAHRRCRIKDPELRAYLKQMRQQVEAKAEVEAPAPVHGDIARRVRNALLRIVCSNRWEQDVVDEMNVGHLAVCEKTGGLRRVLHESEFYPPGGDQTLMLRCAVCQRHLPPQVVGSIGVCYECFKERQVQCYLRGRPIDPDRLMRLFAQGKVTQKEVHDALAPLERVISDAGGRLPMNSPIPRKDAIALLGVAHQFTRERGRALYLADDPRVRGGAVDPERDLIVEPWGGGGDAETGGRGDAETQGERAGEAAA